MANRPNRWTISLIQGIPTFATLIALCEWGVPVVALIELPALRQRYTAIRGTGAWCNSAQLNVTQAFDWNESIVSHGDHYTFGSSGYEALYDELAGRVRFFRSYTDAFGHTLAASGAVAALMVDAAMEPWDLAAPMLVVQEAGGRVALYRDRRAPRRFVGLCGGNAAVDEACKLATILGFEELPPEQCKLV